MYALDDPNGWFGQRSSDSKILIGDIKKSEALLRDVGLQLPEPVAYASDITSIVKEQMGDVKLSVSEGVTIKDGNARWTDDRIERLIREYGASNQDYSQVYGSDESERLCHKARCWEV